MLNSKLSAKADNLELVEEQIWQWWAYYQGTVWQGKIEYPDSFNLRDKSAEIDRLVKARSAATDARVLALIDHEIVECLGEDADIILPEGLTTQALPPEPQFEPHQMQNPSTGDRRIARTKQEHLDLADQGYVHSEEY